MRKGMALQSRKIYARRNCARSARTIFLPRGGSRVVRTVLHETSAMPSLVRAVDKAGLSGKTGLQGRAG